MFICASLRAGRSLAAVFSSTCAVRRAPGIAQLTASNMRIQRSANCAGGQQGAQFLDGGESGFVVDAGERLAAIERFAVAVEVAVVVRGERGVPPHAAGEHAAGQRNTREDAGVALPGEAEEAFGGTHAEAVENDLHGLDAGEVERLDSSTFSTLTP